MKVRWMRENLHRMRECPTYPGWGTLTWSQRWAAWVYFFKAAFLREYPDGTFGGLF